MDRKWMPVVAVVCLATANTAGYFDTLDQPASQQSDTIVFDVASIKPNKMASGVPQSGISPGGRYRATKLSLQDLLLTAYGIERFQLIGIPSWVTTERFDIVATATGELTNAGTNRTLPGALRALIKDRFKLREHSESRDFPVYALKVVREGRLGPNLSPSTIDCAAIPAGKKSPCVVSAPGAVGRYVAASATMARLVTVLRQNVDRPVIDQTGLEGTFKIELNWASVPPSSLAALAATPPTEPLPYRDTPSIFVAIQDQLGLKMEPSVAPFTVVVIDSVQYPTPD